MSEYSRVRKTIGQIDTCLINAESWALDAKDFMESYPTLNWGNVAERLDWVDMQLAAVRGDIGRTLTELDEAQNQ